MDGNHKGDLGFTIGGKALKEGGRQGQDKAFCIAPKLAQVEFLKRTASMTTPILLLDDIFDKLDSERVARIVDIVLGDDFGQTFITDTDRSHLERILKSYSYNYRIFSVAAGEVKMIAEQYKAEQNLTESRKEKME